MLLLTFSTALLALGKTAVVQDGDQAQGFPDDRMSKELFSSPQIWF